MTEQRRFPWWAILLGAGCVVVLCIGALLVGGGAVFFLNQRSESPPEPQVVFTAPVEEILNPTPAVEPTLAESTPSPTPPVEPTLAEPTTAPSPTVEATLAEPTASAPGLTGNQYLDDHSLYDDFSSDALGWPIYDDGMTILKYENEAYGFQIKEQDYYDWAYFPVDFTPYEIWFDVQGLPGSQDGTFGVFCQFQDEDNYYFVEFDLADNSYLIGQYLNGDDIPLTEQNSSGQYWQNASALKASPTEVNRIGVSCYLDSITLFINDEWVGEASVSQPFDQPGEAAFFVYAFDFAGEEGYKVLFDNVETWQPVQ